MRTIPAAGAAERMAVKTEATLTSSGANWPNTSRSWLGEGCGFAVCQGVHTARPVQTSLTELIDRYDTYFGIVGPAACEVRMAAFQGHDKLAPGLSAGGGGLGGGGGGQPGGWRMPAAPAGLASLDFELPTDTDLYQVYRFTTPRGEAELTARNISTSAVSRLVSLAAIAAACVVLWIVFALIRRGALGRFRHPLGASLLLLAGLLMLSMAVPVIAVAAMTAGFWLLVAWMVARVRRNAATVWVARGGVIPPLACRLIDGTRRTRPTLRERTYTSSRAT